MAVMLPAPLPPPHGPPSEWGTSLHTVLPRCPAGFRAGAQVALHCSLLQGFTSLPRECSLRGGVLDSGAAQSPYVAFSWDE